MWNLLSFLLAYSQSPVAPWRSLYTCLVRQQFLLPLPEKWLPRSPVSHSNGGLIQESWRYIANTLPGLYIKTQAEEQTKTPILQFLPGRGLTTDFPRCCLKVQLPTDLHLVLTRNLPLGYLRVLTHPELLGATRNKEGSLDNLKRLRHSLGHKPGRLTRFISYIRLLITDWERVQPWSPKPGGPVVRTPWFHCRRGTVSIPGWGIMNKILYATWCGPKTKNKAPKPNDKSSGQGSSTNTF